MAGFNRYALIAQLLPGVLSQAVRKTAFDLAANAQQQIQANGSVETGFMLNSVYVRTDEESTYTGGEKAFPEVEQPPNAQTAYVGVAANYAGYVNYGTRFMAAKPFFEPAIERTRPAFDEAIGRVEDHLKEALP